MESMIVTVRALGERRAREEAQRAAESRDFYVHRVAAPIRVGPWTQGDGGTELWDVEVFGDRITESEARALYGDR